jgi:hypothetical protein
VFKSATSDMNGLRLLVFDGTPKAGETPLRTAWSVGARVYSTLGRIDAYHGATSWADALAWLSRVGEGAPIAEVQYWGHGKWGALFIGGDTLTAAAFQREHAHAPALAAVRGRMLPDAQSLVWFRTCETFGADAGHVFAVTVSRYFGARAAGHTHVIGVLQSGLHGLRPGEEPYWPPTEGLARGTADAPLAAHGSSSKAPNTLHFMNGAIPPAWFDR